VNQPQSSREELLIEYLDLLPFEPYAVQEEALLNWFDENEGVLICAPTGTGKTLIAEAAMFEALKSGQTAYYTTPLIALTEQKFTEIQEAAIRWGHSADDVGLITGNRQVNPDAKILVVVAEVLLNRLLSDNFDFSTVSSVVMDEFHSFNDPGRGVVWELSLALLPLSVRLMLLSATVGNSVEFLIWLKKAHGRTVRLVQGTERRVPLEFNWVGDELLAEHLEQMQDGDGDSKRTPALVFCFNRAECWTVAEQLKGRKLLSDGQQKQLVEKLNDWDWKIGAGGKLKQLLMRGVGVHHAGMLPKYRRRVETLYQQRLLSVCICTETLAAGINLPARSVVMTSLVKGPPGKKKIIDASSAHQIFGRAGRPQFDDRGFVHALAHEDDVRIARWKQQYDQIPEDTKDPNLIRMKKKLKKKMPTRRQNIAYWTEEQFQKVIDAPSANLSSKGQLPWRLLAFLLKSSDEIHRLRSFVSKRLLDSNEMVRAQTRLTQCLQTMHAGGFIELDPEPEEKFALLERNWPIPEDLDGPVEANEAADEADGAEDQDAFGGDLVEDAEHTEESSDEEVEPSTMGNFGALLQEALQTDQPAEEKKKAEKKRNDTPEEAPAYLPVTATPLPRMDDLLVFRGCHPLYGSFLLDHLALADRPERIQILESVLEVPGSVVPMVRVPRPDELPPGPLARHRIDPELIGRGLLVQADLDPDSVEPELDNFGKPIRRFAKPLGEKLKVLFDNEYPLVHDVRVRAVWIAGDLIASGGDYQKYITSRDLTKQEGIIFRHLLRLILLCNEFLQVTPTGADPEEWKSELEWLRDELTTTCQQVDPESTNKALEETPSGIS